MDKTKSVKLIQSQKSPTSASLQEKHFLESVESSLTSPKSMKNTSSTTVPTRKGRVEDSLISSKQKTQSKINLMQIKKNKEIMETLQKTPQINPTSQLLATCKSTPNVKSKYINSLVWTSKLYKYSKLYRRGLIYKAKICLDHLDLRPSHCKSPLSYNISRSSCSSENLHQKMLENYYSRAKNKRLFEPKVKKQVNHLLEMDTLSRSETWIKQKNLNLEKVKQEMEEKSLQQCTFAPELSPKSKKWNFTMNSFTTGLSFSPVSHVSPVSPISPVLIEMSGVKESHDKGKEEKKFFSVSLSPHRRKVGFRSGMDLKGFLGTAKPMARYSSPMPFYYWNRVLRESLFRY